MPEISHDDDTDESHDLRIRVPGVAYDMAQPGFPRVLVVQALADRVAEYDRARPDDAKPQAQYVKNALVGTTDDDTVYQVVYLPDSPVSKGDLNDPSTRYPVPESRLIPVRAEAADPIDDGSTWSPREAVQFDLLDSMASIAGQYDEAPRLVDLFILAHHAGVSVDVIDAVEAAHGAEDTSVQPDDEAVLDPDYLPLDDGDGPNMSLDDGGS